WPSTFGRYFDLRTNNIEKYLRRLYWFHKANTNLSDRRFEVLSNCDRHFRNRVRWNWLNDNWACICNRVGRDLEHCQIPTLNCSFSRIRNPNLFATEIYRLVPRNS